MDQRLTRTGLLHSKILSARSATIGRIPHIADDVVTVGFTRGITRIEASGFHGREPDEFRWDIDQGKIDSWSTRLTVEPGKNWSGQYSYARITSLEALVPSENQERITASVMYNRPFRDGNWANTLLWGRTRSLQDNAIFDSYLFESTAHFRVRNYAWTRSESAERSNELIIGENPLPPGFREQPIGSRLIRSDMTATSIWSLVWLPRLAHSLQLMEWQSV